MTHVDLRNRLAFGLRHARHLTCGGLLLLASLARAQDTASYVRLPSEVSTPRAIAMGGALVGLGGDISAAAANPASLVAVPRTLDLTLSGATKEGYSLGAAFHPYRRWAFGLFLPTSDVGPELARSGPTPSSVSSLRPSDGRYVGAAIAYKPDRRLALGGSVQWEQQKVLGLTTERQSWANWTVGIFVQPDDADGARIGLAYRHGADRTFGDASRDLLVRVQRPDVWSLGVSWQYGWLKNTRIVMSLQPELVRYPGVSAGQGSINELDLRGGVEASFPFGRCVTGCGGLIQARAGFITRSALPADAPDLRDRRGRTASLAAGVALAPGLGGGKFRLDLSYDRESRKWVLGLAWRFPEAFRGDLQHHRRRSES